MARDRRRGETTHSPDADDDPDFADRFDANHAQRRHRLRRHETYRRTDARWNRNGVVHGADRIPGNIRNLARSSTMSRTNG